jgi:hypothetical protein
MMENEQRELAIKLVDVMVDESSDEGVVDLSERVHAILDDQSMANCFVVTAELMAAIACRAPSEVRREVFFQAMVMLTDHFLREYDSEDDDDVGCSCGCHQ